MIVCVDGTGSYSGAQYAKDMAGSFCKQIAVQKGMRAMYFEGPGGFGLTTRGRGNAAYRAIVDYYVDPRVYQDSPLFLAGYSRGGACVLQIAKWLNELTSIKVKALFLIDPVNRDINLNTDGLGTPANVKTVYALFRDKSIEHVDFPNDPDRYARKWMGTCAWRPQDLARTRVGSDDVIKGASHGAVGGSAWPERVADRVGEGLAAMVLNKALQAEQLNVKLEAKTFPKMELPTSNVPKVTFEKSGVRTIRLR